jgi:sigma-B regulation protein RsbU (phosphoserine phosphatase)
MESKVNEEVILATPRLSNELKEASLLQDILLHHGAPKCETLDCQGNSIPAHYLGGDYYDFIYDKSKQKYWIFTGDVMGKGIPAFAKMAMLRTAIRTLAPHSKSPAKLLKRVNRTLYNDLKLLRSFATLFCGMYDLAENKFLYASAGHPPAVLKRVNQPAEHLKGKGIAIGFLPEHSFKEFELTFNPNDYILVFTDGITEAMNEKREQFGKQRMLDVVNQHSDYQTIIPKITDHVLTHSNHKQRDDITMLTIKRNP